jgi:hypothetical protein
MNKFAILLTTVLTAAFFSVKLVDIQPSMHLDNWTDEQKLQERWVAYRCFKDTLDSALDDLARGDIRLKEAHARVLSAARQHHPDFFAYMTVTEPGSTDEERLAHNLLGHMQSLEDFDVKLAGRMPALNAELKELVNELHTHEAVR